MGMLREVVRYTVTNGRTTEVRVLPLEGPTVELEKAIRWAAQIDRADGWEVVRGSVKFGSLQNGEFLERKTRPVPLFVGGFRRLASHLRA